MNIKIVGSNIHIVPYDNESYMIKVTENIKVWSLMSSTSDTFVTTPILYLELNYMQWRLIMVSYSNFKGHKTYHFILGNLTRIAQLKKILE